MGSWNKKKFGKVQLERFGRVAKYWRCRPSSYIKGLNDYEAFVFDEACLVAVEADNRRIEKQQKEEREREEKEKKEREKQTRFIESMNTSFSGGDS